MMSYIIVAFLNAQKSLLTTAVIMLQEGVMKDESWFVRRAAARSMTMLEPEGEAQVLSRNRQLKHKNALSLSQE